MLYLHFDDPDHVNRIKVVSQPEAEVYEKPQIKEIAWPALEEAMRSPGIQVIDFNGPKTLIFTEAQEEEKIENSNGLHVMYMHTLNGTIILTEEETIVEGIYGRVVYVGNMVMAYLEAMKYFDFEPDDICSNDFFIHVADNKHVSLSYDHSMTAAIEGGFMSSTVPIDSQFGTFYGHSWGDGLFFSPYNLIHNLYTMIQVLKTTSSEQLDEYHFQRCYGSLRNPYIGHPHHTREWQIGTPAQREKIMAKYHWLCEKLGKKE